MYMEFSETKAMTEVLDDYAVREGDLIIIKPLAGRRQEFRIRHTELSFESQNEGQMSQSRGLFYLPHMKNEKFNLRIRKEKFRTNRNQICERYVFNILNGPVAKLNGQLAFSGVLQAGDLLEVGHNEIVFKKHTKSLGDTQKKEYINQRIVNSNLPILIAGETGTGKTSLASSIHDLSGRSGKFVHLNISALSINLVESELFGHVKGAFTGADKDKRGAFRDADQGTLFLDEIDSLSPEIQTKLLLFLDDMKVRSVGGESLSRVDTKIILSSGQKLETLLDKGSMRRDFYYRISSGFQVDLPSLRDQPELIENFCVEFAAKKDIFIHKELMSFYKSLPWPGNYRQLKGHLERKMILSKSFKLFFDESDEYLITKGSGLNQLAEIDMTMSLSEVKEAYIKKIYLKSNKNATVTADKLKISARSVRNLMNQ